MQRNWTTIGAEYVDRLERECVEQAIEELEWQEIPVEGKLTLGFMPGEGINACIRELRIPKVSQVAVCELRAAGELPGGRRLLPRLLRNRRPVQGRPRAGVRSRRGHEPDSSGV